MTDPEIKDRLRRYRPAGPSSDLRARILGDTTPVGRTWPWAVAAAVLLATATGLNLTTDRTYEELRQGIRQPANTISPHSGLDAALHDDELFRRTLEIAARIEQSITLEVQASQALSWQ
jgi:hypothetical protein